MSENQPDRITDRLNELETMLDGISDMAEKESRLLTPEEETRMEEGLAEFEQLQKQHEQRERVKRGKAYLHSSPGRVVPQHQTVSQENKPPESRTFATPRVAPGRGGFDRFGEFGLAVRNWFTPNGHQDQRLIEMRAPTTVGSEGSGADGGFAVPPEFLNVILKKVNSEGSIFSRCQNMSISGNQISIPKDETTPWQISGGVLAYWEGENSQLTQSKPALEMSTLRAHKITCLVPVTDELMDDSMALDSWLRIKAPEKINFAVDLAIIKGSGAGQPLGIANGPGIKTIAKETSQTADTVNLVNLRKMYTGMFDQYRNNAVWVANQDVEQDLLALAWPNAAGTTPAWFPIAGGLHDASAAPSGSLFGRPLIFSQAMETLGDLNDIMLVDFNQYLTVSKGGMRSDVSAHLWFDYDTLAFRFILRIGGMPLWSSTIAARDGSATYGAYVNLAVRA